ncbi:MAG: homoserine dehydrogenase [Synergistes sp.]|nr:homoserine dehydrogenase [Synergistes sp.]
MKHRIALAGCGNVGTALLELLHEKKDELKAKYSFEYDVVLISDIIKGTVANKSGLDLEAVLNELHQHNSFAALKQDSGSLGELMKRYGATVLAECTPTNLKTGEPGLSHIREALSSGISVTTTNKGPLAVAFDELKAAAEQSGAKFLYEGVVMSGTPLIDMIRNGMAGCSVSGVEGILNGTTNFMLTKMGSGATYDEALKEAQALGYAEADPTGDVEGWDAAGKVVILTKILFGKDIAVTEVDRTGITQVTPQQVSSAAQKGNVIKLIAGVDLDETGLHPYVKPREIAASHPLAQVGGAVNAVTVKTDNLGDVTLIGPGAGRRETGQALLSDIIRMGN